MAAGASKCGLGTHLVKVATMSYDEMTRCHLIFNEPFMTVAKLRDWTWSVEVLVAHVGTM